MTDNQSIIQPIIHTVSATQIVNTIVVTSPGPQGPKGEKGSGIASAVYPVLYSSATETISLDQQDIAQLSKKNIFIKPNYFNKSVTFGETTIHNDPSIYFSDSTIKHITQKSYQEILNFTGFANFGVVTISDTSDINVGDIISISNVGTASESGYFNGFYTVSNIPSSSVVWITPVSNGSNAVLGTSPQIAFYTLDSYFNDKGRFFSGSAAYSLNSSSTSQTNFTALTISGSSVATQEYVLANIPASAQYAGSALYATNAGSATYSTSAVYAVNSGSSQYASSAGYISASNISGVVASATNAASSLYSSSAGFISGSNVSGIVASATYSSSANYANNSGSLNGQPGSYYAPATSSVGIGSTRITLNTTTASLGNVVINNSSSVLSPFLILNNTATQPSKSQGTFYYETTTFSPTVVTDTTSPIHMLQQVMIRAVNDSNATILKGQAVYLSGAQGNRPAVKLGIASSSTQHDIIGLVYDDIAAHQDGWIITQGLIEGIDTRPYIEGAYIYLSAASAGYLTATAPGYPNYDYVVAQALNSTPNGKLLVEPYNAYNQVNVNGAIQFSDSYRTIGSGNATLDLNGNITASTVTITSSAKALNPTSGALKVGGGTGIAGDLYVNGNISVAGSAFFGGSALYVSASELVLSDPLIYLAEGNTANVWDIGFVGNFTPTASGYQHTGLARDHTDGKWKLFSGVVPEPTNTINFASATYDTLKLGAIEVSSSAQVSNLNAQYLNGQSGSYYIVTASNAGYVAASAYTANSAWNNQNASVAYATSAENSASLGGSAASIFASKTYADTSANNASAAAYNAASAYTATSAYNNQSASVSYSSSTGFILSSNVSGTVASATNSSSANFALNSASLGGIQASDYALDTSSNTFTGTQTILTAGSANKGIVVQGSSGQTANLQEWQNSSSIILAGVSASGQIYTGSTGPILAGSVYGGSAAQLSISYTGLTPGIIIKPTGAVDTTSNSFEVYSSSTSTGPSFFINKFGQVTVSGISSVSNLGSNSSNNRAVLRALNDNASATPILGKAFSTQSADMFVLQNSSGSSLFAVNSGYQLLIGYLNNTQFSASPAMISASTSGSAVKGLIIQGSTNQSANLIEVQDSSSVSQFTVNANGFVVANNGYQSGTWLRAGTTATVPVGAAVNQPGIALSIVSATPVLPTAGVQLYATTSSLLGIATSLGTLSMSASQMNTSRTDYTLFTSPTTLNIGQAGAGYTLNLATQSISSTGTSIINIGTGSSNATGAAQIINIGTGYKPIGGNYFYFGSSSGGTNQAIFNSTLTINGNTTSNGNITAASSTITAASVVGGGLDLVYSGSFSSASSISVDNVFTTKYTNYKVIVIFSGASGTSPSQFTLRLRSSGVDNVTNYTTYMYGMATAGGGSTSIVSNASTSFYPFGSTSVYMSTTQPFVFELLNPATAQNTGLYGINAAGSNPGVSVYMTGNGNHNTAIACDGFTMNSGISTLTYAGTIKVYGYHN